jgi:hypothetical protein
LADVLVDGMVDAASPWVWQPLVIWTSPSL